MSEDKNVKPCISLVQEFCDKKKWSMPKYEITEISRATWRCRATLNKMIVDGDGISKKEAKHAAAANLWKLLSEADESLSGSIPKSLPPPKLTPPKRDVVMELRDFCVEKCHPLPTIEIVEKPDGDKNDFVAQCTIATIIRFGRGETKKEARENAAREMMVVVSDSPSTGSRSQPETEDAPSTSTRSQSEIEERYEKFKTYRELTKAPAGFVPGTKLCDRHNYFKNFYPELKEKANRILSRTYDSVKEQAMDVMKALKIKPSIELMPGTEMLFIDLKLEFDVVFSGTEDEVYPRIVNYFRHML